MTTSPTEPVEEPTSSRPEPTTSRPEPVEGPTQGKPPSGLRQAQTTFPLWEVFVRPRRGLSHSHVGSVHAPDAEFALQNARDVFTRRGEGVSIWVVPSAHIAASSPTEKDRYFDPAADKVYRHPTFYDLPDAVRQL